MQVCKITAIRYLSLVIGIQKEGSKMPLRRLLCQLKLLILLLIDVIYQVIMIEVYVNYCYSKSVFFLSIMIKCGLIRRKEVCGEMTTIILKDQSISFKLEYDFFNIEINNQRLMY